MQEIDFQLCGEVTRMYEGYKIEPYASGFGFGKRTISFDIFLKDGSRFCVDASYDVDSQKVSITEREYV